MWISTEPKIIEIDTKVGLPWIEVELKLEKKAQCKSLKSVLCVCNTLVRLYDFVYLLLATCLCLYVLNWDKGFCNKHFVYGQGFVQVGDKIL